MCIMIKKNGGTNRLDYFPFPTLSQIPPLGAGFPLVAVHMLADAREWCIDWEVYARLRVWP